MIGWAATDWGGLCQWCSEAWACPNTRLVILLVVALGLLYLAFSWCRRSNRGLRVIDSADGQVQVSNRALHDLVSHACQRVQLAKRPKVRFKTKGDQIDLYVDVCLHQGHKLDDIYESLKRELKRALEQTLGVERVGRVNVSVDRIEKSKSSTEPAKIQPVVAPPSHQSGVKASSNKPGAPDDTGKQKP